MVFVDVVVCIAFGLGLMGMCAAGWLFEVVAVVIGWCVVAFAVPVIAVFAAVWLLVFVVVAGLHLVWVVNMS